MKHISSKGKEWKQKYFHQCCQTRIQIFQNIIRHMCHFTFNNRKGETSQAPNKINKLPPQKKGGYLRYRSRRSRKQRSYNAELSKDQLPGQRAFSLEYAIDWKFNCTVIFSLVGGKRKENYLSSRPMNVGNFYVNGIGFRLFLKSTYVKVTTWEFRNTSVSVVRIEWVAFMPCGFKVNSLIFLFPVSVIIVLQINRNSY